MIFHLEHPLTRTGISHNINGGYKHHGTTHEEETEEGSHQAKTVKKNCHLSAKEE